MVNTIFGRGTYEYMYILNVVLYILHTGDTAARTLS